MPKRSFDPLICSPTRCRPLTAGERGRESMRAQALIAERAERERRHALTVLLCGACEVNRYVIVIIS